MQKKKIKMTLPALISWLKKKRPSGRYRYIDNKFCLVAQFLRSQGVLDPYVGARDYSTTGWYGKFLQIPKAIYEVSVEDPATFGAALKRAKKAQR